MITLLKQYKEAPLGEIVLEEIEMIKRLEMENAVFFGHHQSNFIQISATLPEDRDGLVQIIQEHYDNMSIEDRELRPSRGKEGTIVMNS